jgi:hypothetical protein
MDAPDYVLEGERVALGPRRLSVIGLRGDELLMDAVADEFDSPVPAARR